MTLFQSSQTEQLYRKPNGEVVLHQIPSYEYDSTPIEFSTFIGSRVESNRETFVRIYADFFNEALGARPELYQFAKEEGFTAPVFAEKMAEAISNKNSTLEGQVLRTTLKALNLTRRHKFLADWINTISPERTLEVILEATNHFLISKCPLQRASVIRDSFRKATGDKNA